MKTKKRRDRNLKSIYYDKYTGIVGSATQMKSYPSVRPHRYIYLDQFSYRPTIYNKKVVQLLKFNGIDILPDKSNPF